MILVLCDKCGRIFLDTAKLTVSRKGKNDFFVVDLCNSCEEEPINMVELRKSKEENLEVFKEELNGSISIKKIVEVIVARRNDEQMKKEKN